MQIGTVIGFPLTIIIIIVVLYMDGGTIGSLFSHPSAILLCLVGSLVGATTMSPLSVTLTLPIMMLKTFLGTGIPEAGEAINTLVSMGDKARREGLLALEEEARALEDPFLQKGVMMVVDGVDPNQVKSILQIEIKHMEERHAQGYGILEQAGGFAPTFGIIGTVMGLIAVLSGGLEDPEALAHSVAGAFLATLWGLLASNMIFLPLAGKLTQLSHEEAAYRHLLLEGILALQVGENPRVIRDKLSAFLPPKSREAEEAE